MRKFPFTYKIIAVFTALNILVEALSPAVAYALTGGPTQPEFETFTPIGSSDMVDLFTGDFNYNIPLLDVGGYPVNLIYNSNISMEQEASWVGLGWNLNTGAIKRDVQGIPDDFNGTDQITTITNIKPNITYGVDVGPDIEIFGLDKEKSLGSLTATIGGIFNNYTGIGTQRSISAKISIIAGSKGALSGNLGIKSSDEGLSFSPSLSFGKKLNDKRAQGQGTVKGSFGYNFNSRSGLTNVSTNIGSARLGNYTYTPSSKLDFRSYNITVPIKIGSTLIGIDNNLYTSSYVSIQTLNKQVECTPAYGYFHLKATNGKEGAIYDYNRNGDASYSENKASLPTSKYTYDYYSFSGQGINGLYRPHRNDIGTVHNDPSRTWNGSLNTGFELSSGNVIKVGVDVSSTFVDSKAGKWETHGSERLRFKNQRITAEPTYETFYFKKQGEVYVDKSLGLYNGAGGDEAISLNLLSHYPFYGVNEPVDRLDMEADYRFSSESEAEKDLPEEAFRIYRVPRNQMVNTLTREEVNAFGLVVPDVLNNGSSYPGGSHHISEVSVTREDGAKYYYTIPAYNRIKNDVFFAVGSSFEEEARIANKSKGLVGYGSNDASTFNRRGLDNFYQRTITPAYAHSYLLTHIVSPDYSDIDNVRGPSEGDLGTYTKFNYTQQAGYSWRMPYYDNKANFIEGYRSIDTDNMASYSEGVKDIWYLESIETKNFIAVFYTSIRDDAKGVRTFSKNIEFNNNQDLRKLDKIVLYSQTDYKENGDNATPIKTVHFEYDYTLCGGVPNNTSGGGKLTLKKVYFTYGTSEKAALSPYEFNYTGLNPDYHPNSSDRWGTYKPNQSVDLSNTDLLSPTEFPYTEQDGVNIGDYASAWTLDEILLPSGGKINVTYESDDYAYVQNKQAMQMYKFTSVGSDPATDDPISVDATTKERDLYNSNDEPYEYVYFKLATDVDNTTSASYINDNYLRGETVIYFNTLIDIKSKGNNFEYVKGYFEVVGSGFAQVSSVTGKYTHGYVKVKKVDIKESSGTLVNPLSKAAWQFGRLNMPREIWNQGDLADYNLTNKKSTISILKTVGFDALQHIQNVLLVALGPNYVLFKAGAGKTIIPHKSWMRLFNVKGKKYGGGVRVSKIEISDEWGEMVNNGTGSSTYGQVFEYTMQETEGGPLISSGIAAYEPIFGGEENALKEPVFFDEEKLLAPTNEYYQEKPYGEEFFPTASVGYRKVTVKNIERTNVTHNATGYTVNEFFTAYDFPTIVEFTPLHAKPRKIPTLVNLFSVVSRDYMATSQGFMIETNNMHGKPKAVTVYSENDQVISDLKYHYKSNPYLDNYNRLNNTVTTLDKEGNVNQAVMGLEYDIFSDMINETTVSRSGGVDVNNVTFLAAAIPFNLPTWFPSYTSQKLQYRSTVITKHIARYGILEKVEVTDLGSTVSTENLAYDPETGAVLVTKTKNGFNDPVYSLTYPAHWYYDQMGPAYKNQGIKLFAYTATKGTSSYSINSSGIMTPSNPDVTDWRDIFSVGDVLGVTKTSGESTKLWVTAVDETTVTTINEAGGSEEITLSSIIILSSGRKNLIAVPSGTITLLSNPLDGIKENTFTNILDASAVEFSDAWQTFCECFIGHEGIKETKNPFVTGMQGIWKPKKSYVYLTDRKLTRKNNNTDIRKDGTYVRFNPFWKLDNSSSEAVWTIDNTNWTWAEDITIFSPYGGQQLESTDPLGRYSAILYGYNNSLPVAVGANAKYNEIANDNFEDYLYSPCSDDHFSYKHLAPYLYDSTPSDYPVTNTRAHTGQKSYMVEAGDNTNTEVEKPLDNCNE